MEYSVSSVQSLSCVWLFAAPWTAAYLAFKKNEMMSFAAMLMDPEASILSKSDSKRQILYDITHM